MEEKKGADLFELKKVPEVPFGTVACDVCMKVKKYFCKVVAEAIFSLETLRSSMLLRLFSFFEVKIPPDSA